MRRVLCIAAIALTTAGCASFPLTVRGECKAMGYKEGFPGYETCIAEAPQRAAEAEKRTNQFVGEVLGAALIVGAAAVAATPPPAAVIPARPQDRRARMCPDGSYVYANRCRLMPNGQYIGVD